MRIASSSKHRQIACFSVLAMFALGLLALAIPVATSQTSEDVTALSYRAFLEVAQVYRSGGEAPDLVFKLNSALQLIQEGNVKRLMGDESGAAALEEKAGSEIEDILATVPAAQQTAQTQSLSRAIIVIASIPPAVLLSTLVFIVALRTWRDYERSKLFEMVIVEEKAED